MKIEGTRVQSARADGRLKLLPKFVVELRSLRRTLCMQVSWAGFCSAGTGAALKALSF